ncbi:hypothetical protein [Kineosporia succinea]|uniref:Uncharacterized protein n=1 Tax=Kineosporia succinea TaxID=84632 RepID=A0ABT9NVW3_9ACTN|nr:hypothetical protein [Kineosporia succinea]MDP9824417.1 hypothetical protein [Kineosporia succinea]
MTAFMDPTFTQALREQLIARVHTSTARRRRKSWRIAGALAGVAMAGSAAAAVATNPRPQPGTDQVRVLRAGEQIEGSGPTTIDLGRPPADATHIELTFTCLDAATYTFQDGSALICDREQLQRPISTERQAIAITSGTRTLSVETIQGARWRLTADYSNRRRTPYATNAAGDTYGASSDGHEDPELVAVMATNGKSGYAYFTDLNLPLPTSPAEAQTQQEENRGKRRVIPVYTSDGTTVIGQFVMD